jgi:hypothetical protein
MAQTSPRPATLRRILRLLTGASATLLLALLTASPSSAAVSTVGSPLSVPATLNTSDNLNYGGTNTAVPPTPEYPTGVVHTAHYGADTVLWNSQMAHGETVMPESGQALKVSLEGCAVPAPGGPPPLTQIHFQTLSPLANGGARVDLSSQPFDIPVCGVGGASGSTVSTYEPINLCVRRGYYVALNTEGGFVPGAYRAGVPYRVLGSVGGSTVDSFIRGNGTGNGALLSALDSTAMDGFAASTNEELMLQVQLGTGHDARYVCPGGSRDAAPTLAPFRVSRQTDGVNHARIVSVAVYCRPAGGCSGNASLTVGGAGSAATSVGSTSLNLPGNKTSHVPIRVSPALMTMIRRHHGVATNFVANVNGQTLTQTVTVKIF